MASTFSKRLLSPAILLGAFLLDFVLVVWLAPPVQEDHQALLMAALVLLGILGLALVSMLSNRARDAVRALDEGEHYIESVAALSQDVHALIDAGARSYSYMNDSVEGLLGYGPRAFQEGGLDFFYSLLHEDDRERVRASLEQTLQRNDAPGQRERESVREEVYRIRDTRGDWHWFRSRRTVFERHADGRPMTLLAVAHDITEHRAVEAALIQAQKFESLGTLARGVAHDINNLLMGIQGFADLARGSADRPDLHKANLDKLQENVSRASSLCRQMLAYSGRGRLQVTCHQVNDSVKEALPLVESLMPEGANLVLELAPELPPAEADPSQVRHALVNLVVNAAAALGPGSGGELTIRTQVQHVNAGEGPEGLEGDYVCLEVRDNGGGMTEDTLHAVFDPFFTATHPGRGLGLTTVLGIAREHRGGVWVENHPQRGCSVYLYLPIADRGEIDPHDQGTPVFGASGVLLLVDDEPTIRSVLRQAFEQAGYRVIEAVDGVEGFGAFVRHRSSISAVLLDLTMPRMGGDEVFEEIHKLAPEVPVILMSGYSQQEATEALSGKGLAGFLSKPCSIQEALAVLERALGRKPGGRA